MKKGLKEITIKKFKQLSKCKNALERIFRLKKLDAIEFYNPDKPDQKIILMRIK